VCGYGDGKKTKDRSAITDMVNDKNRPGLADGKNSKIVGIFLIHRLYAVDVGQNKRIISAVADTRKVTIVSANQPVVEVSTDSCYTEIS
jgi:hypothetical protein